MTKYIKTEKGYREIFNDLGLVTEEYVDKKLTWNELKDRPFGESEVVILPETTFEFNSSGQANYTVLGLVEGEKYIVNWNGNEYECTCEVIYYMGMEALGMGNIDAFMGTGNSGHPFVIGEIAVMGASIIGCATGESSATVLIKHLKVDTLNPKYIKDMYYTDEKLKSQATVFEGEFDSSASSSSDLGLLVNMVKGELFRVTINQKEYIREVQQITDSHGNQFFIVGNLSVIEFSAGNTGEPFVLFEMKDVSSETTISVDNTIPDVFDLKIERIVMEEVVHPIPEKYLGLDWIPKKEIVATDTTVYAVHSTFSTGNTDHNVAYDSDSNMPTLSEGRYYSVIYNNEEYVVRAEKITVDTQGEIISLGNSKLYQNMLIDAGIIVKNAKNTDEPFCIISEITGDGGAVLGHGKQMGDTYNITILETEEQPNKLPEVYIPDTIARKSDIGSGSKWKLLNEIDVTEVVDSVLINKDLDGNSISTKHMIISMYLPKYEYNGETGTGYTVYEINGKQVSPATYSYPSDGWELGYFLFDIMAIGERAYIRCYKNENMPLSTGQCSKQLFHLLFTEKGDYEYIKSFEWKVFNRKVLNGSTFRIYGEVDE